MNCNFNQPENSLQTQNSSVSVTNSVVYFSESNGENSILKYKIWVNS